MWSVFVKEVNSFLNSLIAYLVIGVFLASMGLLVWVFPDTSVLEFGYADMGVFFNLAPYILMFLIPAITMKSFSEEHKSGTFELLMTKPITEFGLIAAKFSAGLLLVIITLIPTLTYYFTLSFLSSPVGNIDTAGITGAYVGLLFLASSFTAIGIFASSLSENQIVAFIIAVFISFLLFMGISSLSDLKFFSEAGLQVHQLGMLAHFDSLSKGVIDLRDLLYFFSLSLVFLSATFWNLKLRKWNS